MMRYKYKLPPGDGMRRLAVSSGDLLARPSNAPRSVTEGVAPLLSDKERLPSHHTTPLTR